MKFNEKLLDLRKKKGWSQEELGYKLDVSRQTISKWEAGQTTPELEKLRNLAKIFEISVDELINEEETKILGDDIATNKKNEEENVNNKKKKSKIIKNIIIYLIIVLILLYIILVGYRYYIITQIGEKLWGLQPETITNGYYMEKRTFGSNLSFTKELTNTEYSYSNRMTREEHFYYNTKWTPGTTEENEISRVKILKYENGDLQVTPNLLNPSRTIYIDKLDHFGYSENQISETIEFDEINKNYKKVQENSYVPYLYIIMAEYENMFNTLDFNEDWSNYIKYAMDLRIDISKTKDGDYYMSNVRLNTPKQKDNCYVLINDTRIILEKIVYDDEMKANYTGTRFKLRIGDVEEKDVQFPNLNDYTKLE